MEHSLERKIRYFLNTANRGREDVHIILSQLNKFGSIAIVGGMLRDVALSGIPSFNSDLDLVIDVNDINELDTAMRRVGAKINRFGGYSLPANRWQVDLWPLQRTWAHVHQHVTVRSIEDIKKTTFFKTDAVLYYYEFKKITAVPNFFDLIQNRILEVNLRPNPNPVGNAVRAFRYSLMKGFRWSPDVANFVLEVVEQYGLEVLKAKELHSFRTSYLESLQLDALISGLHEYSHMQDVDVFDPRGYIKNLQLELFKESYLTSSASKICTRNLI